MKDGGKNLKSSFYLVNTNKQWLIKNFQFIQAFFAGTSWLHMKYCMIRPPNVYHVLCPGRFQIYWAAIDMTVTFEGKLRRYPEVGKKLKELGIKSIDEDMLWPEAWKVDVNIRDLTPNNFNLYAEYYQHGFNADEIRSLEDYISASDAIREIGDYLKGLGQELKDAVVAGMQEGYKAITGKDYNPDAPLSATFAEIASGGKRIFSPLSDVVGAGAKGGLNAARDQANAEWEDILNKYRTKPGGGIDYEALYADPRAAERRDNYIRANQAALEAEYKSRGYSESAARNTSRAMAVRAVYGRDVSKHGAAYENLGWER
jgi:hypothetical protein